MSWDFSQAQLQSFYIQNSKELPKTMNTWNTKIMLSAIIKNDKWYKWLYDQRITQEITFNNVFKIEIIS